MFCSNCGKEIDDNAVVCPHCGIATGSQPNYQQSQNQQPNYQQSQNQQPNYQQPQYQQPNYQQPQYNYQYQPQTDGNAIAIVGFVFSFLFSLVGLICSIIGYKKAKNEGAPYKGLALAGIIISAVGMGIYLLYFMIIIGAACSYGMMY